MPGTATPTSTGPTMTCPTRAFLFALAGVLTALTETDAQIVTGVMQGYVARIDATDDNGVDASAAFEAFLPFVEGSPVNASFQYDASTATTTFSGYRAQGYTRIEIGGTEFGAQPVDIAVDDNRSGVGDVWGIGLRFADPSDYLPAGWSHSYGGTGMIDVGLQYGFSFVADPGLFSSEELPVGEFSTGDFAISREFEMEVTMEGSRRSVWESPTGETFSGMSQYVWVRFDSLSVTTVPEPSGICLVGIGWLGAGFRRRRRFCVPDATHHPRSYEPANGRG